MPTKSSTRTALAYAIPSINPIRLYPPIIDGSGNVEIGKNELNMTVTSAQTRGHGTGSGAVENLSNWGTQVRSAIDHASHLLPTQGPITAFVHHNPLHALEDLSFADAVVEGARLYESQPYWSLERYHDEMRRGRIQSDDIRSILMDDLGDDAGRCVAGLGTAYTIRIGVLQTPLCFVPAGEADWVVAHSEWFERFPSHIDRAQAQRMVDQTRQWTLREPEAQSWLLDNGVFEEAKVAPTHLDRLSDAQWVRMTLRALLNACEEGVRCVGDLSEGVEQEPAHVRRAILTASVDEVDRLVHEVLIRFCSNFVDQGFSQVQLPTDQSSFFDSFVSLYLTRWAPLPQWMRGFSERLAKHRTKTPMESIEASLIELGVSREQVPGFIVESLLALRGFAGMLWQLESQTPWAPRPLASGTLEGFLAVRLLLDTQAALFLKREGDKMRSPGQSPALARRVSASRFRKAVDARALRIFQVALVQNWSVSTLRSLKQEDWKELLQEIECFSVTEQCRILHQAYEWGYQHQALDAVAIHSKRAWKSGNQIARRVTDYQVVCCIDDREESFRRHLEEVDPACETFGAAGFFGVAMYYQGASHAHYRPLCPAIVTPKHYVREEPVFSAVDLNRRRSGRRRILGRITNSVHTGSRTLAGGALMGLFGSIATFPLVARVLAPGITSRLRESLGSFVRPPATELRLQRLAKEPGLADDALGYTTREMADIVVRILEDTGLAKKLSPMVVMLGHGSSSLNNPHESAYSCGACSGGRGGPNARAFATMANDPQVRSLVSEAGIQIPSTTWFVGGYHNTCNDRMEYFDLDRVPVSHRTLFRRIESKISEARICNAHERARRFQTVPLEATVAETLTLVEQRSEDLSEARPEYNHATNALCFVGNRWWSRGLFLDRRAFLTSYDPTLDDDQNRILTRILQAVIPVCSGISLEYLFSTVDPEGYGCGSKLPHNIVGLIGVMTGAASDLRPGLSAQMVEIHEPMRILFVIESTPEAIEAILDKNPGLGRLVRGQWVRLATFDPQTSSMFLHDGQRFQQYSVNTDDLPQMNSSLQWYRNWRDHLGFASIIPTANETGASGDAEVSIES